MLEICYQFSIELHQKSKDWWIAIIRVDDEVLFEETFTDYDSALLEMYKYVKHDLLWAGKAE